MVGVKFEIVVIVIKSVVLDGRFYRCLLCKALCEYYFDILFEMLKVGGKFYDIVV